MPSASRRGAVRKAARKAAPRSSAGRSEAEAARALETRRLVHDLREHQTAHAFFREQAAGGLADPRGAPRDDCDLSFQSSCHGLAPLRMPIRIGLAENGPPVLAAR